ncbi:MAG: hypothetical protein DLM73_17220 [Chthoniobacterales bacterium]|nr:MAG: hypothetical protein DLM73_17220 [Chthoniobacterales bacterium]
MKSLTRGVWLILFVLALGLVPALQAEGDYYAAIAYSPSTGRWGYGTAFATRSDAIIRALKECKSDDAVMYSCHNEWIALALSNEKKGGFGWASAPTAAEAEKLATDACLARNPDAHIVICVAAFR